MTTKEKWKYTIGMTLLFYLLAHGYRFFSTMFSGDSLLMIHQNDYAWQIALGRCFQPIWLFLRGCIVSPWLINALAMLWLCLSVCFTVDLLQMESKLQIALVAAVMCINLPIICLNATFLPWLDLCAMALFFATFGVWLLMRDSLLARAFGILMLMLSLGTYQAYICVAIALFMLVILQGLLEKRSFDNVWKRIVRWGVELVIAGGLYFFCWKMMQKIFHIWTSNSYNGLSSLGDYADSSVWDLIAGAYERVFSYFWNPSGFVSLYFRGESLGQLWVVLLRVVNALVLCLIIAVLLWQNHKNRTAWWSRGLQALLMLLFPLGINIVYVLSKGMEHTLMIYAFQYVYILAILLMQYRNGKRWLPIALAVMLGLISWSNLIFANQLYLKKALQEEAALSLMTRVVDDIEDFEGYIPGQTPVAFVGCFERSGILQSPEGLEDLELYGTGESAMFYEGTEYAFLRFFLNTGMNLTRVKEVDEEIDAMPVYPQNGSMGFYQDMLVVKISN